jgi:hypothetical protein
MLGTSSPYQHPQLRFVVSASVRDVVEFEALPEETQALARRVLNAPLTVDPNAVQAYKLGWEHAIEKVNEHHFFPPIDMDIEQRIGRERKVRAA